MIVDELRRLKPVPFYPNRRYLSCQRCEELVLFLVIFPEQPIQPLLDRPLEQIGIGIVARVGLFHELFQGVGDFAFGLGQFIGLIVLAHQGRDVHFPFAIDFNHLQRIKAVPEVDRRVIGVAGFSGTEYLGVARNTHRVIHVLNVLATGVFARPFLQFGRRQVESRHGLGQGAFAVGRRVIGVQGGFNSAAGKASL